MPAKPNLAAELKTPCLISTLAIIMQFAGITSCLTEMICIKKEESFAFLGEPE
jgi:hypothetical protein